MQKREHYGFTIVELLVVIVVVGILAAITIVSYTGINQRAVAASLQSDLGNSQKQIKLFQVVNSAYPSTINCSQPDSSTNKCLRYSGGNSYNYKTSLTNLNIFCLEAINSANNKTYSVNQDGQLLNSPCPVLDINASSPFSYSGTGTTWRDMSGNDNNGTLLNGITYSNSGGGSMSFDGLDDYVQIADSASLRTGSVTVSVWYYIRDNPDCDANNNWRSLIRTSSATSGSWIGFDIVLEEDRRIAWDTGTGTSDRWWPSGSVLPMNTWSNLTVVYDSTGSKQYYLEGVLMSSKSVPAVPISPDTGGIFLSEAAASACPNGNGDFPGLIKSVRIYGQALSADQIKAVYNATK